MQKIIRKLCSRRGASLVFAMVFMLFCAFVGGSVLAAATANGGRIQSQADDQQAYLNQRSVASVLADDLAAPEKNKLQNHLNIIEKTTVQEPIIIMDGGGIQADPSRTTNTVKEVIFEPLAEEDRTPLRELLFESAAMRYLSACNADSDIHNNYDPSRPEVTFKNFPYPYSSFKNKLNSSKQLDPLTVNITDPLDNPGFQAQIVCLEDYDFAITFGANAMLNLHLNARTSTSEGYYSELTTLEGGNYLEKVTTNTISIYWDDTPSIVKGGAAS